MLCAKKLLFGISCIALSLLGFEKWTDCGVVCFGGALAYAGLNNQTEGGKKYRIAFGGIQHESNMFNPYKTTLKEFQNGYIVTGDAIVNQFRHEANITAGSVQELLAHPDVEIVPLLCADATPGGVITDETFTRLVGDLLDALRNAGHIDGVVLANHGAMLTESIKDADGYIMEHVRKIVGPQVPIAVGLDFHGNASHKIFENVNIVVAYKRYPHIDRKETGRKAAELLYRTVAGEIKPAMAYIKLPIIPGIIKQLTEQEPMKPINDMLYSAEAQRGILSASLMGGFNYADAPQVSSTIVVIADNNFELAKTHANRIAEAYWKKRGEFKNFIIPADVAVAEAAREKEGPVILVDTGDNIGGGTPADGSLLLRLVHEHHMSAVVIMYDPAAVEACIKAGVGNEITISVGGKLLKEQGGPVELQGRVRTLFEGRYFSAGYPEPGLPESVSPMVLFIANKLKVILTSRRLVPQHLSQLRSMGITPENEQVIVVKAAVAWREFYEPIAKKVFLVATPGYTSVDNSHFEFHNLSHPLYPFDEDATWP